MARECLQGTSQCFHPKFSSMCTPTTRPQPGWGDDGDDPQQVSYRLTLPYSWQLGGLTLHLGGSFATATSPGWLPSCPWETLPSSPPQGRSGTKPTPELQSPQFSLVSSLRPPLTATAVIWIASWSRWGVWHHCRARTPAKPTSKGQEVWLHLQISTRHMQV